MFEWIKSPELQGVAALIAIIEFAFLVVNSIKKGRGTPSAETITITHTEDSEERRSTLSGIIGILALLLTGWVIYSIPWVIMVLASGFAPSMVVSPLFVVLGSLPPIGSLLMKSASIGGFVGGGIPLGTYAIYGVSINPSWQQTAPPLAWFVVFVVVGGTLGALEGPAVVKIVRKLQLPLPFE